ncbi:MAG TPA: 4'-phosphopantetheinyl transferase superfamily protein [Candidatus Babeliales bacterium]|nr:4'-phosphopantetheinyl transferase superfamily protein [Candidatus Babeliales bacterium]
MGIGIDSVEVARCVSWIGYSSQQLSRIFSHDEINYASSNPAKKAERLAARFAAKEAFCKGLHAAYPGNRYSLLTVCRAVAVLHGGNGAPYLVVDWRLLGLDDQQGIRIHLSITHTKTVATAYVVLEL